MWILFFFISVHLYLDKLKSVFSLLTTKSTVNDINIIDIILSLVKVFVNESYCPVFIPWSFRITSCAASFNRFDLIKLISHDHHVPQILLNIVREPREDAASNVKPPPETPTIKLHPWWLKLYRSGFMLTRESVGEKQLNPLTFSSLDVYDAAF